MGLTLDFLAFFLKSYFLSLLIKFGQKIHNINRHTVSVVLRTRVSLIHQEMSHLKITAHRRLRNFDPFGNTSYISANFCTHSDQNQPKSRIYFFAKKLKLWHTVKILS
jgi:hypothetical protein